MEEQAILELNLDRYRRLLESETDPARRRTVAALIRETQAKMQRGQMPQAPASTDPS
jgi:hypothetical protein